VCRNTSFPYVPQVLALVTYPDLLESSEFPADAKAKAKAILGGCGGGSVGSYSLSPGVEIIRRYLLYHLSNLRNLK